MGKKVLRFPEDARTNIARLQKGLEFDAALAALGTSFSSIAQPTSSASTTGIRAGGRSADEAVRTQAPGLLARFALISMVSRIDVHAQELLLMRRVSEQIATTGKDLGRDDFLKLLRAIHVETRTGPVSLCSKLIVTNPSARLAERMEWLGGIVRVRNCLSHRMGRVSFEDIKPAGTSYEALTEANTLKVKWLRLKVTVGGQEIVSLPHQVGGTAGDPPVQVIPAFVEYEREWKLGDQIEVSAAECQHIALSLQMLANQLLADFEHEMNTTVGSKLRKS